jgi:hypothetical protein
MLKYVMIFGLACTASQAATKTCYKAAKDAIDAKLEKNGDDCAVSFTQPGKDDADILYFGVSCDHTGNYIYRVPTVPSGHQCGLGRITSKLVVRNF